MCAKTQCCLWGLQIVLFTSCLFHLVWQSAEALNRECHQLSFSQLYLEFKHLKDDLFYCPSTAKLYFEIKMLSLAGEWKQIFTLWSIFEGWMHFEVTSYSNAEWPTKHSLQNILQTWLLQTIASNRHYKLPKGHIDLHSDRVTESRCVQSQPIVFKDSFHYYTLWGICAVSYKWDNKPRIILFKRSCLHFWFFGLSLSFAHLIRFACHLTSACILILILLCCQEQKEWMQVQVKNIYWKARKHPNQQVEMSS